ncbi:PAS domain S-box protein [Flavobacterium hauense]
MQDSFSSGAGTFSQNNYCRIGFDRTVLENMPVAMYTCGIDGTITFYNLAAAELWGREPDVGIEKWTGAMKLYSASGDILSKDYHPLATMIAEGKAPEAEELIIERPDGSTVHVMPHLSLIYDANGAIAGAANMLVDITEKRKKETALQLSLAKKIEENSATLKQSEERYHKMIDEVQDYAIIMLDAEGNILNWNKGAQKIKGYTEEEVLGQNFRIFYLLEDREKNLPDALLKNARSNGRAEHEGWRLRKDGTKFWSSVIITALHDDNYNVIGFSKVTRDLTERKFAEDRLRNNARDIEFRNKQLEEYAYIASHDLQEPLRKIQVFSEMLMDSIDDKEAVTRYIDKITASAGRMTTLIKDVLKYSQLSSTDELFEVVNLNAILENVLEDFDLLIEQKKIKLTIGTLPVLKGIPIQLHQLFSNLLSNAIKFGSKNPEISITAEPVSINDVLDTVYFKSGVPYIKIIFKDNGQGFEQEYADMVFKMFKRLDNTPGTGIGLALCKKIVENHNGGINAKSQPGEGSEFNIFLPLI